MILEEALNMLMRHTMNLVVGQTNYAIKSQQKDAPRPSGPYGDVLLMHDRLMGWEQIDYSNRTDMNLDVRGRGIHEVMFSLGFYRDSAIDNARRVHAGIFRESIRAMFRTAQVGLARRSEVRQISEPLESGFEERAQFDIFLSVVGVDSDIVTCIESVDMNMEYQARGLVYNSQIEVNRT